MKNIASIEERDEVGALASMTPQAFFRQMQGYQADAGAKRLTARMEFGNGGAMLCVLGRPRLSIGVVGVGREDASIVEAVRTAARTALGETFAQTGPSIATVLFEGGTVYVGAEGWILAVGTLFDFPGL